MNELEINNNSTKSLLETYFRIGYSNLISKRDLNSLKKTSTVKDDYNTRDHKFRIKVFGSSYDIKEKLVYIDDLLELDLLTWIKKFEAIAKKIKWSDVEAKQILENMIKDESIELDEKNKNYDELKQALLVMSRPRKKFGLP